MTLDNTAVGVTPLQQSLQPQPKDPLKSATEEFEGMFISYLLKVMRSTVDSADKGELSMGKDLYADMFDNEIALSIARTRGLGIGEMMYRQLQEGGADQDSHLDQRINRTGTASPDMGQEAFQAAKVSAMSMPVQGRMTSDYGFRLDPLTGDSKFHEGIDLAAAAGTPFKAAAPGTVMFSGDLGGYGNTVVLEHENGERTLYAHASQILVRAGDRVEAGQEIGRVGSTGRSTGAHLHFETLISGQNIDPKSLISAEVSSKVHRPKQR
jgi:murein DD-endopeptidase MepM/ murein hydrolase activator NlpD